MTLGRLDTSGTRPQLVFTRTLAHAPEKVWRALTEPQHLAAWFPDTLEGTVEAGATLRFVVEEHDISFDGEVTVFEPPRLLEFRWGHDTLRFELRPDGDGTVLTLTDTIDELGKAARDGAGWHECLDLLEIELAGDRPAFAPGVRFGEVHPRYVAVFGSDASTVGPPGQS
jgi:uncharacterized protein YndB with AHSA1/START domain